LIAIVVNTASTNQYPVVFKDSVEHPSAAASSGIIGALDNDFGTVGIAPGATIWSVKVLNDGGGDESDIAIGINWVTAHSSEIEFPTKARPKTPNTGF